MNITKLIPLLVFAGLFGCTHTSSTSCYDSIKDEGHLAEIIYKQELKIEKGEISEKDIIQLLKNKKVVFIDSQNTKVSIRDIAVILYESTDIALLKYKSNKIKLICSHSVDDPVYEKLPYRYHIPDISDEEFKEILKNF